MKKKFGFILGVIGALMLVGCSSDEKNNDNGKGGNSSNNKTDIVADCDCHIVEVDEGNLHCKVDTYESDETDLYLDLTRSAVCPYGEDCPLGTGGGMLCTPNNQHQKAIPFNLMLPGAFIITLDDDHRFSGELIPTGPDRNGYYRENCDIYGVWFGKEKFPEVYEYFTSAENKAEALANEDIESITSNVIINKNMWIDHVAGDNIFGKEQEKVTINGKEMTKISLASVDKETNGVYRKSMIYYIEDMDYVILIGFNVSSGAGTEDELKLSKEVMIRFEDCLDKMMETYEPNPYRYILDCNKFECEYTKIEKNMPEYVEWTCPECGNVNDFIPHDSEDW